MKHTAPRVAFGGSEKKERKQMSSLLRPLGLSSLLVLLGLLAGCDWSGFSIGGARPVNVYVGSSDKHLYAFDLAQGTARWKCPLEGEIHSQPLLKNEHAYVGATDGKLYAVDSKGRISWATQLVPPNKAAEYGPRIFTSPVLMSGVIFVASPYQGTIYAVDLFDGKLLSSVASGTDTVQWLTAAKYENTIFVNAEGQKIYAFSTLGHPKWEQTAGGQVVGPLLEGINGVLVGRGGTFVYMFDPSNGKELTSLDLRNHVDSIGVFPDSNVGSSYCTLAGGEVVQLYVDHTGQMQAKGLGNPLQASSWVNPNVGEGSYGPFVASVNGAVTDLTRAANWPAHLDSNFVGAPLVARFNQNRQPSSVRVVVISRAGHIYGVNPDDGKVVWQHLNVIGGTVDSVPTAETP